MKNHVNAMMVAAIFAEKIRHYDAKGHAINRSEYRRKYGTRKGGGRGEGFLRGLPKSSTCLIDEITPEKRYALRLKLREKRISAALEKDIKRAEKKISYQTKKSIEQSRRPALGAA